MKYVSSTEMRILELNSQFLGVDTLTLMENAGRAVTDEIAKRLNGVTGLNVVVFAGLGNNGGDGMVTARHLASRGARVVVILAGDPERIRTREARENYERLANLFHTVDIIVFRPERVNMIRNLCKKADVLIDALLGTGLKGSVREPYKTLISIFNESNGLKLAVDIPSGLDSDTGEVLDISTRVDFTVTFHAMKRGLVKREDLAGDIVVADIGIPIEAELIAGPGDLVLSLKPRIPESKKGDYGRVLVVGGSEVFSGAPALTALAAQSVGVDIVIIASPSPVTNSIRSFTPTLIVHDLEAKYLDDRCVDKVMKIAERVDAIAIGPGLGLRDETLEAVLEIIRRTPREKPIVIDADALKALARELEVVKERNVVLTPHAGEFKILFDVALPMDYRERMREVERKARELKLTILLKGPWDVISNGYMTKVNITGNAWMTVGGTGDVLTGIVAAFLAQGCDTFRAACAAAFLNGLVGDYLVKTKGGHLSPLDLVNNIPTILTKYEKSVKIHPAVKRALREFP